MRRQIRRVYSNLLQTRRVVTNDSPKTAIVFAPHPDDETLGCGGTIVRRLRQGVRVVVVVMTDGRVSHAHLMPQADLVALRAREVQAACAALGVAAEDVILLGFEDGRLESQQAVAVERVAALMQALQPTEVFVPHQGEAPPDHRATYAIVCAALQRIARPMVVYEYAVWYWHHWPWVALPIRSRRGLLAVLKQSLSSGFGIGMLREFNHSEPIEDVVAIKRTALEHHASQMQRLIPDPRWATLHDVAGGEFLARFFDRYEPFRRTVMHAEAP